MNVKNDQAAAVPARTTKAEQSEATRSALVAAARPLFAERGYAGVGTEEIVRAAGVTRDPLDALHQGAAMFLEACRRPEVQRITLIDAPSVLGWERWREIGVRYGFGLIEEVLKQGMEQGVIERQPVRPLTHLLLGAMDEAAMLVARSDDAELRAQVAASIDRYLDTLAPRSA